MKFEVCVLARAVAGAALAGVLAVPALAGIVPNNAVVTTGDGTATVAAPQLAITIGGASATDKALGNLVRSLCVDANADGVPDDLTTFRNGTSGNNYQGYYCTIDAAQVTGLSGNLRTLIRKRSKDGSGTGALPVCTATAQAFMKIDSNCTYSGSLVNGVPMYNCSDGGATDTESIPQTNAGITDVAPGELFGLASTACDVIRSIYGADMSIIATTSLRNALQCAQGKTVGSELAADVPTLSKALISSIQTGVTQNWSQVTFNGLPLTDATRLTGCGLTAPASTRATYLRREPTSGTFAANELRINSVDNGNGECGSGNFGSRTFPGVPGTGPIVPPLQAGSGDIDTAMNTLNSGGSFAQLNGGVCDGSAAATPPFWFTGTCTSYNTLITTVNAQKSTWAISHQTTERNGNNGAENTNQYRTIAIDGVVPTLNNVAAGKHDFWVESHGQYLTSNLSADQKAVVDQLFTNAKSATEIAAANSLNTGSIHSWGQGGIFAIKNTGSTCTTSTFNATTNPCSAFTRARGGSSTPNCSEASVQPAGSVIAPISP